MKWAIKPHKRRNIKLLFWRIKPKKCRWKRRSWKSNTTQTHVEKCNKRRSHVDPLWSLHTAKLRFGGQKESEWPNDKILSCWVRQLNPVKGESACEKRGKCFQARFGWDLARSEPWAHLTLVSTGETGVLPLLSTMSTSYACFNRGNGGFTPSVNHEHKRSGVFAPSLNHDTRKTGALPFYEMVKNTPKKNLAAPKFEESWCDQKALFITEMGVKYLFPLLSQRSSGVEAFF